MLAAEITGHSSYAEKEYVDNKGYRKIAQKALLEKSQEGAARTIAEQGKTYDHIGKMMILNNGKKTHEKNLVGERHCRNKKYC